MKLNNPIQNKFKLSVQLLFFTLTFFQTNVGNTSNFSDSERISFIQAVRSISEKFDVYFTFDRNLVKDVVVDDEILHINDLDQAIRFILENTQLEYKIISDRFVIIYQKTNAGIESMQEMIIHLQGIIDQEKSSILKRRESISVAPLENVDVSKFVKKKSLAVVSGRVVDSNGIPLPGVNIVVKGTSIGTSTDVDGYFELNEVDKNTVLIFSFIGYLTQEISLGSQLNLNVILLEDSKVLDEVVVVGFGTQKKVNLTGAVSQVTSELLESRPVTNIGQALQGAIPNLNIGFDNGSPNTDPKFNVRGGTSFFKNDRGDFVFGTGSPLILVDGVEMDISQLNPEDVESISVLKDAASAAIYGARAAYGVMLITTKSGRNADPLVSYSSSLQFSNPAAIPNQLDAITIQEAAIKAVELQNQTASSDLLLKLDKLREYQQNPNQNPIYFMDGGDNIVWLGNFRPYEEAISNAAPTQKHNLSLSGGNDRTSYYASVGYQGQEGIYKINTDEHHRYNLMLNFNTRVNRWFDLGLNTNYNKTNYSEPVSPVGKGGWWTAMNQDAGRNINMPVKTPADSPVGVMYTDNILSFMDYGSRNVEKKQNILFNLLPTINLTNNWNIKANLSYRAYDFNRKQVIPTLERIENRWNAPTTVHTNPSSVEKWSDHSDQYTINIFSNYNLDFGKNSVSGLVGYNQEWYEYTRLNGKGEQILSPFVPVIDQTLGNEFSGDIESHWAIRGAFYRLTYNYDDRYLFESNGRYDGTSRFPQDSRFKFFPSFSAGWRVSEEQFASPLKHFLDELKIRASYGNLGNQNVSNYIYIPSYGTTNQVRYLFNGSRPVGIRPPGLVDNEITWETATTIDFGVDLSIYEKFDFTFDWYRRTTSDILVDGDKFPAVLGASAPTKNSGEMETKGWEFVAKYRDRLKNGLLYDFAFNLSDYRTQILSFDGNPNLLINTLYDGRYMGEIWGFETVGLFQNQEEIDNAPSQNDISTAILYPGDVRYRDLDGDGKIGFGSSTLEDSGDRRIIGNSTPRLQFGFIFNSSWKGFDFNLFLQGVGKRDVWISHNMFWGGIASGIGTYEVYNNSWTPTRTDAYYPGYRSSGANRQTQTRYLQNGAYLRLKNITLGYSVPRRLLEPIGLKKIRIYGAAYNIWEATSLPDTFDPELLTADYPLLRSIAMGLQINF